MAHEKLETDGCIEGLGNMECPNVVNEGGCLTFGNVVGRNVTKFCLERIELQSPIIKPPLFPFP